MRTSYSKYIYLLLIIILIIGISSGLVLLKHINNNTIIIENIKNIIDSNGINRTFIINHIIIISIILTFSLIFIGLPLSLIYIFYNGITIGFTLSIFFNIYHFKGIIYALLYVIVTKSIYLFLLFILIKTIIKISILLFNKNKRNETSLFLLYKKGLLLYLLILFNDIILYFTVNSISNILYYIIK